MHIETAAHSGVDSLGRSVTTGKYVVTTHGQRHLVDITEDTDSGSLGFEVKGARYALEELHPAAVLSRLDHLAQLPRPSVVLNLHAALARARAFREELARIERALADELGCQVADGSVLADGIMAAVWDGTGSEVDLLDYAGSLNDGTSGVAAARRV